MGFTITAASIKSATTSPGATSTRLRPARDIAATLKLASAPDVEGLAGGHRTGQQRAHLHRLIGV
jgi:hypothetical protein